MAATPFGRFLRKLRIDNDELLGNMADKLGISSAYLSAVENGKKNVTGGLVESVVREYGLGSHQAQKLRLDADH